jgi:hypothetical protein
VDALEIVRDPTVEGAKRFVGVSTREVAPAEAGALEWSRFKQMCEEKLADAIKADHGDAPFPMDESEAASYHRTRADLLGWVLDMWPTEPPALRTQPPAREDAQPALTVWYGSMPESNGRQNWTAILRRVTPTGKWDQGFCFARSEYPERVRYEADRMRWIIGELAERPDILAYDEKKHSGYVAPSPAPDALRVAVEALKMARTGYCVLRTIMKAKDLSEGYATALEHIDAIDQALATLQAEQKGGA